MQAVIDPLALASIREQPTLAQHRKIAGNLGLALVQRAGQLTHAGQVVIFSLGMYLVVYGLSNAGLVHYVTRMLNVFAGYGVWGAAFGTGFLTAILSSIMNNMPTVLIGALSIQASDSTDVIRQAMVYANITRCNPMSDITIYHNPQCATSRNTLALIRNSGVEPQVIEYLQTPPSRQTLQGLIAAMGIAVRDLIRIKGTPYETLGLGNPDLDDAQLIDAMLRHPILINRPIVVTPLGGAALPAVRGGAGYPDAAPARPIQQGRRPGNCRRTGQKGLTKAGIELYRLEQNIRTRVKTFAFSLNAWI